MRMGLAPLRHAMVPTKLQGFSRPVTFRFQTIPRSLYFKLCEEMFSVETVVEPRNGFSGGD